MDQQVQELKKVQAELWEKATLHESIVRQKSRSKWIKEGDSNTSYFHKIINNSRRRNALRGMLIDGIWVENHNLVNEPHLLKPNLDGVSFNVLTPIQRDMMVDPFKEGDIRCAEEK